MTRITNADQVLLLLRGHLERADRARRRKSTAPADAKAPKSPLERAQAIAGAGELSDEDIRRTLLSGILAEEFGGELVNDPGFQQVVADILQIISGDERANRLLGKAVEQLTAPRR